MSKRAEDLAKQLYPDPKLEDYDDILVYRADRDSAIMGRSNVRRVYEQAEKDLGWISVKDRLPEKKGWYFTCVEQFKIPQCVGTTYFDKKTNGWYNEIPMTKRILVSTIEIVDYWMDIPALPKEEK